MKDIILCWYYYSEQFSHIKNKITLGKSLNFADDWMLCFNLIVFLFIGQNFNHGKLTKTLNEQEQRYNNYLNLMFVETWRDFNR